jgi:hypothetical protein
MAKAPRTSTKLAAATPFPAPLPILDSEEDRFAHTARELEKASLDELRRYWRRQFARSAPTNLTRALLYRLLMYRLQAEAFGDLDPQTVRLHSAFLQCRSLGTGTG